MIDIKLIREHKDLVKANINKKFQDSKLPLVDEVYDLDKKYRELKVEVDNLRKDRNLISENIGLLMRTGEKDKAIEVTDEQIIEIIAKEAKKRKDAAQDFEKSGREDLINQNNKELEILTSYLPKQLDIEEIENIVKDIIKESGATSMKDMGIVMKTAKEKIGASADGKTISDVVKKLLS